MTSALAFLISVPLGAAIYLLWSRRRRRKTWRLGVCPACHGSLMTLQLVHMWGTLPKQERCWYCHGAGQIIYGDAEAVPDNVREMLASFRARPLPCDEKGVEHVEESIAQIRAFFGHPS